MLALSASTTVALGLRLLVEGACPSQAAVQAQLAPLLPGSGVTLLSGPSASSPAPDVTARVEPLDDLLRVEVRDAGGHLLSLRDQRRDAPCTDLAAFAAVVIATAIAAQPPSAPPALTVPPPTAPTAPRPAPPRLTLAVSGAGILALTSARTAVGGSLDLLLAQPSDAWGVRLTVGGSALRRVALDVGGVDYARLHAGLLARYRWRPTHTSLAVDVAAGVLAAYVHVEGVGLAQNLRSQGLDLGSAGGLRLTRLFPVRQSFITLSADVLAVGWLRPQVLRLINEPTTDTSPAPTLPAWDILLSLGLGWQRRLP